MVLNFLSILAMCAISLADSPCLQDCERVQESTEAFQRSDPGTYPSQIATIDIRNLRVEPSRLGILEGVVVFDSHETSDVNGDGDTFDRHLHLFDARSGTMTRLDLALDIYSPLLLHGRFVAFHVSEANHGQRDLNGDGDASDDLLYLFDTEEGSSALVGPGVAQHLGNRFLTYLVFEGTQGQDMNHDGDLADSIVHVYDAITRAITNLGLARRPISDTLDGDDDGLIAFPVLEAAQGRSDLNGDGDTNDGVLHVHDAGTGHTINSRLAGGLGGFLEVDQGVVVFRVEEIDQGGADLNGDGDTSDGTLHYYSATSGTFRNIGVSTLGFILHKQRVAFAAQEFAQGRTDLNNDGDDSDEVLHVLDTMTGIITNAAAATERYGIEVAGRRVIFPVSELRQGNADLNSDGDPFDTILFTLDATSGEAFNTRLAIAPEHEVRGYEVHEPLVAVLVSERSQGDTDLNSDADAFDNVLFVVDAITREIRNSGLAAQPDVLIQDDFVAFNVAEVSHGLVDLNDDGDITDDVLHLFNTKTDEIHGLELAASKTVFEDRLLAFTVPEFSQGLTDLNGDGDALDRILHVANVQTTLSLGIDIKPNDEHNTLNPSSRGVILVALLGAADFNVLDVDSASLAFGPGKASPESTRPEDANADGFADLLCRFRTQASAIGRGDEEACLSGVTLHGTPFFGCDAIRTVPEDARIHRRRD